MGLFDLCIKYPMWLCLLDINLVYLFLMLRAYIIFSALSAPSALSALGAPSATPSFPSAPSALSAPTTPVPPVLACHFEMILINCNIWNDINKLQHAISIQIGLLCKKFRPSSLYDGYWWYQ
jgi:hypothetical protein